MVPSVPAGRLAYRGPVSATRLLVYHALKALARDGLILVVDTGSQRSRPERTRYELTEDGEQEFFTLLRESLWRVSGSPLPMRTGVSFTWLSR